MYNIISYIPVHRESSSTSSSKLRSSWFTMAIISLRRVWSVKHHDLCRNNERYTDVDSFFILSFNLPGTELFTHEQVKHSGMLDGLYWEIIVVGT